MEKSSFRYNQNLIGKTLQVLVTDKDRKGEYVSGLTEGKINVRIVSSDESLIGNFIQVRITGASEFSIAGEPVFAELLEEVR